MADFHNYDSGDKEDKSILSSEKQTSAAPDKEDSRKSCTSDDESRVTDDFKMLKLTKDEPDANPDQKLQLPEQAATKQATSPQCQENASHLTMHGQPANSKTRSATTGHIDVWSKIFNELSDYILDYWKDFLRKSLDFKEASSKIKEIDHDERRLKDKADAALTVWYHSRDRNSTYQELYQILVNMGKKTAGEKMEDILRDHGMDLSAVITS